MGDEPVLSAARAGREPCGAARYCGRGPCRRSAKSGGAGPTAGLVASGLLARLDERHVTLPWSVRLSLRAQQERPLDVPPPLLTTERPSALVDRAAAGAAFELVRRTELLLDRWSTHPPTSLKAGGLGVRDLRASATLLHVEPAVVALVIEAAAAAGIGAVNEAWRDRESLPSPAEIADPSAWLARVVRSIAT